MNREKLEPLDSAMEHAAEHLPEGWRISVSVERGAGWVVLWDDGGMDRARDELENGSETSLAEIVMKAVGIAKKLDSEEHGGTWLLQMNLKKQNSRQQITTMRFFNDESQKP